MSALWGLVDEAVLFALFSFCAQLLLLFLRGGSSVHVRLVPSPAQGPVFNYEIRNIGDVVAEDIHVTFDRPADDHHSELWNTPQRRDLHFESLAPGEVYASMFCFPSGWGQRPPVTVTVCYRSGRLFRRLIDVDPDERWWWRLLGSRRLKVRRRKTFVLDPARLMAFRANIGYAGKSELEQLIKELRSTRLLQERLPARAYQGQAEPATEKPAAERAVVRTESLGDQRVQRRDAGGG